MPISTDDVFCHGDTREDGFKFYGYRRVYKRQGGYVHKTESRIEVWLDPVEFDRRDKSAKSYAKLYRASKYSDPVKRAEINAYMKEAMRKRREEDPICGIIIGLRNKCKRLGILFNLDRSDIVIPHACPVLGIPLVRGRRDAIDGPTTTHGGSPTVDRVDPTKGYTKGNVLVVSRLANVIKSNATPEEILKVANFYKKLIE